MTASRLRIPVLTGFLAGCAVASISLHKPAPIIYLCTSFVLLVIWLTPYLWLRILCALALGFLVGWIHTERWRFTNNSWFQLGDEVSFRATVVEPPDIRSEQIFLTVAPHNFGEGSGRLLIKADRYPTHAYGDELLIRGTLKAPEVFSGFNYPLYLERHRVYATMSNPKRVIRLNGNKGNPILARLYRFRTYLESSIQNTLPEPEASFLAGILLGSKRAIPTNIQDALRATGTSHIIAISGANITILLDLILKLIPSYKKNHQLFITITIGTFMALLTGASASVFRGATIASLGLYIAGKSRRVQPTTFILLGMSSMLLVNPLLLIADPGFQLSFAAFAGLAYFSGPIKSFADRYFPLKNSPEAIRAAFAETTAATTATSPLSFVMFGQISLLGLLVNPLILWLLPAITSLGLIQVAGSWLPGLAKLIQLPLWFLLHAVLTIINWFGRFGIGIVRFAHD